MVILVLDVVVPTSKVRAVGVASFLVRSWSQALLLMTSESLNCRRSEL